MPQQPWGLCSHSSVVGSPRALCFTSFSLYQIEGVSVSFPMVWAVMCFLLGGSNCRVGSASLSHILPRVFQIPQVLVKLKKYPQGEKVSLEGHWFELFVLLCAQVTCVCHGGARAWPEVRGVGDGLRPKTFF